MNIDSPKAKKIKRKTVTEMSHECLTLILQLRSTDEFGEAKQFKFRMLSLFEEFDELVKDENYDIQSANLIKFALVAFLDETIICSQWDQKNEWLSEPLQLKLFSTFNAGEEFFDKINILLRKSGEKKEALEIYYYCLILGFKGKYQLQKPEEIRKIIDEISGVLYPEMYDSPGPISPHGQEHEIIHVKETRRIPLWIYPAAAVLISIIFYLIMSGSISSRTEQLMESLKLLL